MRDDVWLAVLKDMEARRVMGVANYGKTVDALDWGEDWMKHSYEEAIDLCVYLKAAMLRRDATEGE